MEVKTRNSTYILLAKTIPSIYLPGILAEESSS